jgi:hypothetical protein
MQFDQKPPAADYPCRTKELGAIQGETGTTERQTDVPLDGKVQRAGGGELSVSTSTS